jgi:hypothetical protein
MITAHAISARVSGQGLWKDQAWMEGDFDRLPGVIGAPQIARLMRVAHDANLRAYGVPILETED